MTLVGEAYFSVKTDRLPPFIVSVSHDRLRVKVLEQNLMFGLMRKRMLYKRPWSPDL